MSILQTINGHNDLLRLSDREREILCGEIREFLVSSVAKTGGHLASNLGVVELSVAIETVYDTEVDRLVFDVGHQSYVHKLLTGRAEGFTNLRQFGGMAGFPKPSESNSDAFVAGHASTSVSIALGMARARSLQGLDYQVVALIGDGATTGGVAYEGLNNAAVSGEPMVVILNDNAMSIDRNVGGMAKHLSRLRSKEFYLGFKKRFKDFTDRVPGGKTIYNVLHSLKDQVKRTLIPTTIFENMGFTYLGPVDGNDVNSLISLLRTARDLKRPVLLHIMTKKGCGYLPAEEAPAKFHGIGKFDPLTGQTCSKGGYTFSDAFGRKMLELAQADSRICAITAAMPGGTGLLPMKQQYPARIFDVGIAEEHAVSMAGGLAKQGMIPVVAIYSTFLQRSYDMIMQDIALLHLHVIFAVDRAGLVGEDGETHHGTFDIGFLRQMPGMTVLCPVCTQELQDMLEWAAEDYDGPVAIRYPRGGDRDYLQSDWQKGCMLPTDKAVKSHRTGKDVTLITYGTVLKNVMDAAQILSERGIEATVLRLLSVTPIPVEGIVSQMAESNHVVVIEEVCTGSGIREALAWELHQRCNDCCVDGIDLGSQFVTHGNLNRLYQAYGLDDQSIAQLVQEVLRS